ncbi:unnamed protein product, partial [Larinioides sclopetarius]
MKVDISSNHVFERNIKIEINKEEKLKSYLFLRHSGEPPDDNNKDGGQEAKLNTFIFLRHGVEPPKDNNNDDGHEDLPSPKVRTARVVLQDEPEEKTIDSLPQVIPLPPRSRQNSGQLQNS